MRDPTAKSRKFERLRVMTEREPFGPQRPFECRAKNAGFNCGGHRLCVDVDHTVHLRQIQSHDGIEPARLGESGAADACSAAIGHDCDTAFAGRREYSLDFFGCARKKDSIRYRRQVTRAQSDQVMVAAAKRMERALK